MAAQWRRDVGTATLRPVVWGRTGEGWKGRFGAKGSHRADRQALAGLGVRAMGNRGGARGMARSSVQGAIPFPLNPV
jgi:hypothetical protein